jgi:hypothetical protein
MRKAQHAAIAAERDRATKEAFDAVDTAVKGLVGPEGPIRPSVPVGRLTTSEIGWIGSSAVSAWVWSRAAQAALEGLDAERLIHTTGLEPDPWTCGAVAAILSQLADKCPDAPWASPVGEWPKEAVVALLIAAFNLIQRALAARDAVAGAAEPPHPDLIARALNAVAGNGLLTAAEQREFDDPDAPPF